MCLYCNVIIDGIVPLLFVVPRSLDQNSTSIQQASSLLAKSMQSRVESLGEAAAGNINK